MKNDGGCFTFDLEMSTGLGDTAVCIYLVSKRKFA